jgi:hypothetical protein
MQSLFRHVIAASLLCLSIAVAPAAQQVIGVGTTPNDHTGDSVRAAYIKTNENFTELYARAAITSIGSGLTLNTGTLSVGDLSLTYQPTDGDLTALSALAGTNTLYYRSGASAWSAVTIGSNLTFSGGILACSIDLTAPGPIGSGTPDSGAFSTLSASSTVSGAGFTALFASPPSIGSTAAGTGAFTTLTATGNATIGATSALQFGSSGISSPDTILLRDAANTLAQRNGVNAQKFVVYATYTDGSNNRRVAIDANGANASIQLLSSGTGGNSPFYIWNGTSNILSFGTGGAERFQISSSGHLLAGADNTYDIGASGATRPRDFFLARNAILGGALNTTPANGGAVTTGGTISTSNTSCVRVSPAAAVTGMILGAGTVDGQRVTIANEATAANTVTFAAAGTSNVADGTSSVIAGLTARSFVWISNSSRWFPEK